MQIRNIVLVLASIAGSLSSTAFAQSNLPTVDEAFEISAKTGRPIFAMAGQET
ncbi:MAG: hypothetical protein AB8B91_11970 [Rubripirellula sp.]